MGITLKSPVILFTYHPETLSKIPADKQISTVIAALKKFPDATLIITGANADSGGQAINKALEEFAATHPHALFRLSFGSLLYLSAMAHADVVVGNSSSGVIEVPALGKATVNIGDRQTGRLRTPSVIDCECGEDPIVQAITRALSPEFQKSLKPASIFGTPGQVAIKIAERLISLPVPASSRKVFYDV
jgi:UDP-N-acetylglucosamine 2-epimerase (non-hydrolysing)